MSEYAHYGTGRVANDANALEEAQKAQAAKEASLVTNIDPQRTSGYAFKYTLSHHDGNAYTRAKQANPNLTEYQWRKENGQNVEVVSGRFTETKYHETNTGGTGTVKVVKKAEAINTVQQKTTQTQDKAVASSALLDKTGKEINQIELGKSNSHIKGIIGKSNAITDEQRKKEYEYRLKTGKNLSTSSSLKNKVETASRSYLSTSSVQKVEKLQYYAGLPITSGTNSLQKAKIEQARDYILKATPSSEKSKIVSEYNKYDEFAQALKDDFNYSNKDIQKVINGETRNPYDKKDRGGLGLVQYESNIKTKEEKAQRLKEYQDRLKKEDIEVELDKWAGDSKLKKSIAKIYESTYDTKNLSKAVAKANRKTEYNVTRPIIEKPVNKAASNIEKTETYKKLNNTIGKDPAIKALSSFVKDEYNDLTKKPLTYAAEILALEGAGKVFKYGGKAWKAGTEKAATKLAGKNIAEKSVSIASKKIAVKEIPMLATDAYFVGEVLKGYSEGANRSNPKDTQWITESNLKLTKDLAVMGHGAREGKSKGIKTEKVSKRPIVKEVKEVKQVNKPYKKPAVNVNTSGNTSKRYSSKGSRPRTTTKESITAKARPLNIKTIKTNIQEDQIIISELIADSVTRSRQSIKQEPQRATGKKEKGLSDTSIVKRKPTLELVEYKGKVFSIPSGVRGTKRNLLLKKMYEGKPINATPDQIASGKISRKQIKSKAKPKEEIIVNKDQINTVYLTDLLFTGSGAPKLFPLKVRVRERGKGINVKPEIRNVKSEKSKIDKQRYRNDIRVNKTVHEKATELNRIKRDTRLTKREIDILKREKSYKTKKPSRKEIERLKNKLKVSIRERAKGLRDVKLREKILNTIRTAPMISIMDMNKILEKVKTAEMADVKTLELTKIDYAQVIKADVVLRTDIPIPTKTVINHRDRNNNYNNNTDQKKKYEEQDRRKRREEKKKSKDGNTYPKIEEPVVIPKLKKKAKLKKTKISKTTISRSKRQKTNVIGSLESIFGSGTTTKKKVVRKATTKRKVASNKQTTRKAPVKRKTTTRRTIKKR